MSLLKSASIVSLLTLASRITGLVREQLMASAFGASATTDAFQVAFRIPNLLRRLFAEGAGARRRFLDRLVLAQDTGTAITGAVRADYYAGSGPEAGELAGRLKQPLRLWVLWPR